MDNNLAKPESVIQRITWIALGIFLAILLATLGVRQWQMSDPYIKSVLSLTGNPVQGHAIFQMNCAGCHGFQADGRVGPSLKGISERKSQVSLIRQVISGKTPPMPQFQPSPQEMADLLDYLKTL
ncbi:MAG: cytochrome c [Leptolyngbyaceae bacterium]|nr:cytochrome c [Leptolyngbyaceae bacterium]